jgi:hypothetical protein
MILMVMKPIEQTALSLLTDSFVDSSIVFPLSYWDRCCDCWYLWHLFVVLCELKTSTDSSNEDSDLNSLMQHAVDAVENLTSPELGNLEFQKLKNVYLNNSLFDIFYTKSYSIDILNIVCRILMFQCVLGFVLYTKQVPYVRTVLYYLIILIYYKNF